MKKIMIINIVLMLVITIMSILGDEFVSSYQYFTVSNAIHDPSNMEMLGVLGLIMGGIFIISWISTLIGKKFNIKLLRYTGTILLSTFIIFLLYFYSTEYLEYKKEYNKWLPEYINQAKEEIENDKVIIEYFGLLSWCDWHAVDSITDKYGVELRGLNTSRLLSDQKARETYLEIVNAHLEKRNGKGWEQRMEEELDPYFDRLGE